MNKYMATYNSGDIKTIDADSFGLAVIIAENIGGVWDSLKKLELCNEQQMARWTKSP